MSVVEQLDCSWQVEYHFYHRSEMTLPRTMLEVMKGLEARNVRVFHSEVPRPFSSPQKHPAPRLLHIRYMSHG